MTGVLSVGSAGVGRLIASSPTGPVALTVIDGDFRPVAEGVGRLEAVVPPGIYEVIARAGPVTARRLVRVAAGADVVVDDLEVPFPAPSPTVGTSTALEDHAILASDATRITEPVEPGSGILVVVVRDVRGASGPPLRDDDLDGVELLDATFAPVTGTGAGRPVGDWAVDRAGAAAFRRIALRPGGYIVRRRAGERARDLDQAVWIAAGWQTIVFLLRADGDPSRVASSVHLTPLAETWRAFDPELGPAFEMALWELRDPGSVRTLLDEGIPELVATRNPMFGLVAATALLRRRPADIERALPLVRALDDLLPGHPDVAGLWAAMRLAGAGDGPGGDGVAWPPMLLEPYLALVRLDAERPGTIAPGSPAEAIAAQLAVAGAWTTWRPLPRLAPRGRGRARSRPHDSAEAVLRRIALRPDRLRGLRLVDPAERRVAAQLAGIGDLHEFDPSLTSIADLPVREVAAGTHLPESVAREAIVRLGALFPPPTDGDGDDGDDRGPDAGPETGPGPRPRPRNGITIPFRAVLFALLGVAAFGLGAAVASGIVPWPFPGPTPTATQPPSTPTPAPATPSPSPAPTPILELDVPPSITFGRTPVGVEIREPIVIRNVGNEELVVRDLQPGGQHPNDWRVAPRTCVERPILVDMSCSELILFRPSAPGLREGQLTILADDLDPVVVQLVGTGLEGVLDFDPARLDFDVNTADRISRRLFAVARDGPVQIAAVSVDGPHRDEFAAEHTCGDTPITDIPCEIVVLYTPPAGSWFELDAQRTADLLIETTGGRTYRLPLLALLTILF